MIPATDGVFPSTTLVVLLGASEFPRSPNLESTTAFSASAEDLKRYFLDEDGFNLPRANLLDSFNSPEAPSKILDDITDFLANRQQEMKQEGSGGRDLLVYYTGHGGFTATKEYFLALRNTRQKFESGTSLRMSDLASTIKEGARPLRRFLILDCCFSAAAFKEFQSAPLVAARVQTMEALPREGTTLLCSSNSRTVSVAPEGAKHTMFSGALLEVLQQGAPKIETPLSMEQVGAQVKEAIRARYPDEAVRPEVLSPDQRAEDIADIPLFPNAATRPRRIKDQIDAASAQLDQMKSTLTELSERVTSLDNQVRVVATLQSRIEALESRGLSAPPPTSPQSQLTLERLLLQSAPPRVLNELHRWQRASWTGVIWVMTVVVLVAASLWSLLYHGVFGIAPRYDPINWLPILALGSMTSLNSDLIRRVLLKKPTEDDSAKTVDGSIPRARRSRIPPSKSSENSEPWERARAVLVAQRAKYYPLFGSLEVVSPYYEISLALLSVQAVVYLLLAWIGHT